MVERPPEKAPLDACTDEASAAAAPHRTGSATSGLPSRIASAFIANVLPTICPPAAARCNGELPSRPLSTGPLNRALGEHRSARLLRHDRRADRADRQPRRAQLQRAGLQRVEADHRARRTEGKAAAAADPSVDRDSQRLNPAVGKRTVELGECVELRSSRRARARSGSASVPAASRAPSKARTRPTPLIGAPASVWRSVTRPLGRPPPAISILPSILSPPAGQ